MKIVEMRSADIQLPAGLHDVPIGALERIEHVPAPAPLLELAE